MKANMIRSKLALLDMTQEKLAGEIGISRNTMTSRMTGKSSFTLEEIEKICAILQIHDAREKSIIFLQ